MLPFDTLSHGKGNTYFADGIQDEILSNLAKVSQLKVISRTSVMTLRPGDNRNLRSIAESLGVANVVEGTVRRDGNRVRITIRLVDARTDKALWSESYDRNLTDIFAIQSEIAQAVASKLSARLSPEEKKWIEAKPTENLESYDLYLRAKELIVNARVCYSIGPAVEKALPDAIGFLKQAIRLDPTFTLAYCAIAEAHDFLYLFRDPNPEQRALADAAVRSAVNLQPDLSEVHLAQALHLYNGYRDYDRARVQLAIARRGLPNNADVLIFEALIDRRQGNFEKAIQDFNEAITRDPRNSAAIAQLGTALYLTRQFGAAEQAYDRLVEVLPDQPIFKVYKAYNVTFMKTGEDTALRSAIAALPASMADNRDVLSLRLKFAINKRDWPQAKEVIQKMKGGEDEGYFAYAFIPVSVDCYSILLARLQGEQAGANSGFAETREQLSQKILKSPGNAQLLSQLAVVDALLSNKEAAIAEAKRTIEILPISKDAVDGPSIVVNLAVVYAWTDEPHLAFETLDPLTKAPCGVFYGQLKRDSYWDPLRTDPRYDKLLAELAPKD